MPNRLADETSPYLLQHKDNPVDWYAWGEEAFALAAKEDRPVFLSVGYSSCHWCHVMAHESFEDEEVAEALNRYFVCVKLDREERPDVDEAYMAAVQIATGHGGWPMSVFMTPDKRPFYAGTYFPKDPRGDYPGFRTVVASLGQAWEGQRSELEATAEKFAESLRQVLSQGAGPVTARLEVELLDGAVQALHAEFDFEHGGFGKQPKFPPHSTLRFLIEYAAKRHLISPLGARVETLIEQAGHMALMTLEKMALGGIHDLVGGGFHRYSTDGEWRLPHFEKMLSDNALLLGTYWSAADSTGDTRLKGLFSGTAGGIAGWLEREMLADDGLFQSAIDADSEGEEGLFYVWTVTEVGSVLGDRAETFVQAFGLSEKGNFHDEASGDLTGRNVLVLGQDAEGAFDEDLALLMEARSGRERPLTDDKAILGLNGLAIGALAAYGRVDLATACAERWLREFGADGVLPHQICRGVASGLGFLDDYAYFANGLLDLADATDDTRWSEAAAEIVDAMCSMFRDGSDGSGGSDGSFFYTSERHEHLFGRTKPAMDSAMPSPVAEAARALFRSGRADEARRALVACLGWMQRMPRSTMSLLALALDDLLESPDAPLEADATAQPGVTVLLEPREITVDSEGWAHAEVVIQIPERLHINSNDPPAKWLTPTTVRVEGVLG
ncbi:MAG: thioredoxin domain-containing protein, partial [Armatimonadetes bacterium]|nr:thioredoxin domain-containing protein [Armatimonadota bacterium]